MTNRISRRTAVAGVAALPFAALGLGRVLAQDESTPDASPQASPSASPMASPAAAGAVVEVDMLDTFAFEPNEFEIAKGGIIRLTNVGFLEHDFQVDEWEGPEMEKPALNGQVTEVVVPEDAEEGESYEFYCSVPGHREGGMVGTVTIVAAS